MTTLLAQRFVENIEAYYGKYERPATRKAVLQWLIDQPWSKRFGVALWADIKERVSTRYRQPPDIAQIREIAEGVELPPTYDLPALPSPDDIPAERDPEGAEKLRAILESLVQTRRMR